MKTARSPILLQKTQTVYKSTVTARVLLRAGANPYLKGPRTAESLFQL